MSHLIVNGVDKTLDHIYVNTGSIVKEAWEAKSRVILHGLTNPLCGISTYKDTLDLSTGPLTRYIKQLVLTGQEEEWNRQSLNSYGIANFQIGISDRLEGTDGIGLVSHFVHQTTSIANTQTMGFYIGGGSGKLLYLRCDSSIGTNTATFKQWLASEYSAGHPVTVWYVLATPTTETITVPSNLTGTVEGFLTQTGTPSPTNPIYPTANGTLEQGGTYSLDTGAYAIAWGRTDTFTGTSSISVRGYGLPVKSWEIDGNNQQSGTPAPDAPVDVVGCGDKLENLFDAKRFVDTAITTNGTVSLSGNTIILSPTGKDVFANRTYSIGDSLSLNERNCCIPVSPATEYTIIMEDAKKSFVSFIGSDYSCVYGYSRIPQTTPQEPFIFTTPADCVFIVIRLGQLVESTSTQIEFPNIMLVKGSEAPSSYIPYGYAIKPTYAGQTSSVYLGQVQTTRKIRKLVLTGTEPNWTYEDAYKRFGMEISTMYVKDTRLSTVICTHYPCIDDGRPIGEVPYDSIYVGKADINKMFIKSNNYTTIDAWKQWLSDQYAARTPVIVWYVLAIPETGITNEPLEKIGTYADILTSDQAGITIPTTDGSNTISVDTALAPSKFEVKVHAKPIHYGFKIDKSISDPSNAVIYTHDAVTMTPAGMDFTNGTFNYGSWENVWFIKNARPVMLNFDGTEAYDLDPDDYSKKLDGTPSDIADSTKSMNAMIAFPTVWIKRTDDGSYNYIEISDLQLDSDFHAYAHENASGVVQPYIYLPIFKGSMVDGKLRSISGVKPQSGTTAQQEVDAASALGTGWQIWDYTSKEMLCDLLTLISKSLDTQGKFGQGHSIGGSSASDFLKCGTLNDKGKFFGYSATTSQVKCFGMEALWAERWDRELGLILDAGIYKIKEHPAYNLTGEGYTAISTSVAKCPTSNNYIKTEVSTQSGSLPTVVGGTQSTYYCDYFYQNQSGVRVALRGGYCASGDSAGLRYVNVNSAASNSNWLLGTSPVYKPI